MKTFIDNEIVRGILIGSDWDASGLVKKFSLVAAGELEFEVVSASKHINLLDFLRATVEAKGNIKDEGANGSDKRSFFINSIRRIERIEA